MKILLAIMFLFISNHGLSYNHPKCRKTLHSSFLFGGMMSSTSFVSSTGDCAMIGEVEHDKKVFIAQNFLELMLDSAKGEGKYLKTYARMNGCDILSYSKKIQQNYSNIFISQSPEMIHQNLEQYSCLKPIGKI